MYMYFFKNIKLDERRKLIFLLLFVFCIIFFRQMDFFLNPRFWAEEGNVYFFDAYINGFSAIFHAHQNYFSIVPNVSTYISTLLPLEYAPLSTLFFSTMVMLIPAFLIVFSKSKYLAGFFTKIIAILIIYFVSNTEEVWLNTINSQFWFLIVMFVVLVDDKNNLSKIKYSVFLLIALVSGLSGVPANLIAPVFLAFFILNKSKLDISIFLILFFTSLIQLFFILSTSGDINRFTLDLLKIYAAIKASFVGFTYSEFSFASEVSFFYALILSAIMVFLLINKDNYIKVLCCLSIVVFGSIIMTFTSLDMIGGGRYFFPIAVIYIYTIFYFLRTCSYGYKINSILYVYIFSALLFGFKNYPVKLGFTYHPDWYKWADEVKKFEQGEQDFIYLYPQWDLAPWKIYLPRLIPVENK